MFIFKYYRLNYILKKVEKNKPKNGWRNDWIKGWISNYEISDYMKNFKYPNLYFFRFNQIRDIKNIEIYNNIF